MEIRQSNWAFSTILNFIKQCLHRSKAGRSFYSQKSAGNFDFPSSFLRKMLTPELKLTSSVGKQLIKVSFLKMFTFSHQQYKLLSINIFNLWKNFVLNTLTVCSTVKNICFVLNFCSEQCSVHNMD